MKIINGTNRRKTQDRRANDLKKDQEFPCNRRHRPCRRLNNISVEEVHIDTFIRNPSHRLALRKIGFKRKNNQQFSGDRPANNKHR